MSGDTVALARGSRLLYDGEVAEIVSFDGASVTLRGGRSGQFRVVQLSRLVAAARPAAARPPRAGDGQRPDLTLRSLTSEQRDRLAERAGHVREVLSGYRSGFAEAALPGEPRPQYAADRPATERYRAKAAELGVSIRTVARWAVAYQDRGEPGLADTRLLKSRGSRVDPRWEDAVRQAIAGAVDEPTLTQDALLFRADQDLDKAYGEGTVPRPPKATAYRRLAELAKGTYAFSGAAKLRRSKASGPSGVYGRLRPCRPGEYVILDTNSLDVYAMEPVTCRWVSAQLTIAQDLFTRAICGLRVTPVSTKAADVAAVLYQTMVPQAAPDDWPEEACWPYVGVPQNLVFSEAGRAQGIPPCPPETIIVDHGRAFLSAHVIGACTRLGISIQPAHPYKPTDKPTVERFFRTLREELLQYLPGYKGPDVHSRGLNPEAGAFLFLHELEEVIRQWIAQVYHPTPHDGLCVPEFPRTRLSPNEMYDIGIGRAGLLRIPAAPELAYELMEIHLRKIEDYGVEVGWLRYNGKGLNGLRNQPSPYGGELAGDWPVRVNPADMRWAYMYNPREKRWFRLQWEHAAGLRTPFSAEAAGYARTLARRRDRWPDPVATLKELLARWDKGEVETRRQRRIAVRIAAENAAAWPAGGEQPAGAGEPPDREPRAADEAARGDDDEPARPSRSDDSGDSGTFEVLR